MPRHSPRASTRKLAFALALVIALQGLAAAAIGTFGRLHTHEAPAAVAAIVVLDDLRRGPAPGRASFAADAAQRHGHSHAAHAAARHHHAADDASVVADGADPKTMEADDAPAGNALAGLVAIVSHAPAWGARPPAEGRGSARGWVPRMHQPEPLERPPRST